MEESMSREEVWELARGVILGHELCQEAFTAIDEGDEKFHPWSRVHELVEERREQALKEVRKDRSFLRVRVGDLATSRGGRVPDYEEQLVYALSHQLSELMKSRGVEGDRAYLVSWPARPHPDDPTYHDMSGHPTGQFARLLEELKPTWVDVAAKGDSYYLDRIHKSFGDPHQPEEMALKLVARRLGRVASELGALVGAWKQELEEQRKQSAEQSEAQELEDAWSGFFGDPAPEPEKAAKTPARERPVAPQLGDGDGR